MSAETSSLGLLRQLGRQYPDILYILESLDSSVANALIGIAESGEPEAIRIIRELGQGVKSGTRKPKSIYTDYGQRLTPEITDILTFGFGPCCGIVSNGEMLSHVPLNQTFPDYGLGLTENGSLDFFLLSHLRESMGRQALKDLLVFPGTDWQEKNVERFKTILGGTFRGRSHICPPGDYTLWLGQSIGENSQPGLAIAGPQTGDFTLLTYLK